jgi:hypothetical protein
MWEQPKQINILLRKKLSVMETRDYLLSFDAESCVSQFPIQN